MDTQPKEHRIYFLLTEVAGDSYGIRSSEIFLECMMLLVVLIV